MSSLWQKTAFITGASSGIGMACAKLFAQHKCNLIICARRFELVKKLAKEIKEEFNVEVLPLKLDVSSEKGVNKAIDKLPKEWANIDILINNAGGALGLEKLYEGNVSDWEQMIDTNVKGILYLIRKIVPNMISQELNGHIINIGSIAGVSAYANGAVYCATKSAVKFISDGLRLDTVDKPIRVTNIQPGLVETNFSSVRFHGDEEKAKKVYEDIRALSSEDIADMVFYAASRPKHVQICEMTITPTCQASGTVVHRG